MINGCLFASLSKKPSMGFNVSPLLCPAPCRCFVCVCMLSPQFLPWGRGAGRCLSPWGVGATLSLPSVARGLGWVHIGCTPAVPVLPSPVCPAPCGPVPSTCPGAERGARGRAGCLCQGSSAGTEAVGRTPCGRAGS